MDPFTPGSETSEYAVTRWVMTLGAILEGCSVVLSGLPSSHHTAWVSMALSIIGGALILVKALGYTASRTQLKIASLTQPTLVIDNPAVPELDLGSAAAPVAKDAAAK